jgi:hypothetical protein
MFDENITDAEQEALVDDYIRTELKDSLREYEEHPERFHAANDVWKRLDERQKILPMPLK